LKTLYIRMRSKRILRAIRRLIRSTSQYSHQIADQYGVTVPQLLCLQIVVEHDGLSAGEVSREMDLSQSTCVGILDRLEKKGLLRRERSQQDRRVVRLHCTADGKAICGQTPTLLQDRLTRELDRLPDPEQEGIAVALERIVDIMNLQDLDAAPIWDSTESLDAETHFQKGVI
jgi:DNA-binding MarR family transcriptional regulator